MQFIFAIIWHNIVLREIVLHEIAISCLERSNLDQGEVCNIM
jgi:hypothetical protein